MTKLSFRIKVAANNNEHARHHVGMGVDVGSPDMRFEWVVGGTTQILYLELKAKNGRLSDSQRKWNEEFDLYFATDNCSRAVAYGFNEAKQIIQDRIFCPLSESGE